MPIPVPASPDVNAQAVARCWALLAQPGHITRAELRAALEGTR